MLAYIGSLRQAGEAAGIVKIVPPAGKHITACLCNLSHQNYVLADRLNEDLCCCVLCPPADYHATIFLHVQVISLFLSACRLETII